MFSLSFKVTIMKGMLFCC